MFLAIVVGGADITRNGNVNLGLGDGQLAVFGNGEGGVDVVILVAEHVGGEFHWIFADNGAGGFVFAFEHNIFFIEQAAFAGEFVAGHALGLSVVNLLFGVTRHADGDFGLGDGQRAAAEGICVVGVGGLHIYGDTADIGDAGYSVAPVILLGSSVPEGGSFGHFGLNCCGMGLAVVGPAAAGDGQLHIVDEVGHEGVVAGDIVDGVGGVGGHFLVILGPVHKGVVFVGCGREGDRSAVVVGACTGNGTTSCRVGCGSDGVGVELEVGHEGAISSYREAVGSVGGYYLVVLGPVDEAVASIGRSGEGSRSTIVIGAVAGNRTTCGRVGRGGDSVGVGCKVSHEGACTGYGETVGGVGRYLIAILCPVDEVVACAGSSGEGSRSTIVVGACAAHVTAIGRVSRGGDFVGVKLKVGRYRMVSLDIANSVLCVACIHRAAIVGPIYKGVAGIGRGGDGSRCAMFVGAGATYVATCGRVGRSSDSVGVGCKVGHEVAFTSYGEAVAGISGYHIAILCPVDEVVACAGSSGKGSGCAMVVGAVAGNRTTCGRAGRGGNFVSVELEVGRYRMVSLDIANSVLCVACIHRAAIVGPIYKGVAGIGRGGDGSRCAMFVGAGATYVATCGRVGRSSDSVGVGCKVGHEVAFTSYGEAVAGISGYHIAILCPVDEVVACAGSSGKGSGCAMVVGAVAGNRTTCGRVGRGGDGVLLQRGEVG